MAIAVRKVAASKARQNFSRLLREVYAGREPLVIEKGGMPVAAVISPASFERWLRQERLRAERLRVLEEIRSAFRGIPAEEIEREALAAADEVRHGKRSRARRKSR